MLKTGSQSDAAMPQGEFAGRHIHFIGISGSGMRALAAMLMRHGAIVSGSDRSESETVANLRSLGATVYIGQCGENISDDCDIVVYSAAIKDQNPEFLAACEKGCEVLKYAAMLGRMMKEKTGIAIAGTHGKSTTTAMVAYILRQGGVDPSFVVGANVQQLGGPSDVGGGEHFVAEACEFDSSFLHLSPKYATILNIEEDHLDYYRDIDAIIEAFRAFADRVKPGGVIIANGEDRNVRTALSDAKCKVETFGMNGDSFWRGVITNPDRRKIHMEILRDGKPFGELLVPLAGLHNAYNCLAATALLYNAGLDAETILRNMETFRGACRRMTYKGCGRGITVVDDFAHHPTEIQVTLRALRDFYQPKRLICVFQPHQHSRTRFLLKDFAQSFALAEEVIVPDIYFVRDSEQERDYVSSKDLVAQIRLRGGVAVYFKTFELIVEYLKGICENGDLVVTMGAGNVWEIANEMVQWLGKDS
ncbi:MAG TPA: UDP-N-acetylmuramate--L-alanine ligase [Phycisphaerae bacterium]|nr:UDP-N-acetylmuramate--L-alanine ligase [Phycisphaerae bacterium]HPS53399.1 UDP-N-acetylmuramate--L-alanine ligase [Phycisphaerae bacterium]